MSSVLLAYHPTSKGAALKSTRPIMGEINPSEQRAVQVRRCGAKGAGSAPLQSGRPPLSALRAGEGPPVGPGQAWLRASLLSWDTAPRGGFSVVTKSAPQFFRVSRALGRDFLRLRQCCPFPSVLIRGANDRDNRGRLGRDCRARSALLPLLRAAGPGPRGLAGVGTGFICGRPQHPENALCPSHGVQTRGLGFPHRAAGPRATRLPCEGPASAVVSAVRTLMARTRV